MRRLPHSSASLPNLLRNLPAIIASVALLTLVLMFSMVVIAVVVVVGAIAWGYLMWKTRHLRRQMRQRPNRDAMMEEVDEADLFRGEVVEGEVISVADTEHVK